MSHNLDAATVAEYLIETPYFFEEHAELLGKIKLTSPLLGRAISLQERQMEVLREKIKVQDLRLAEMMRHAHENDGIADKLQTWSRSLLQAHQATDIPQVLVDGLQDIFSVPQATLRIWNVSPEFEHSPFANAVSDDSKIFATGLSAPFCGSNNDFEAASWLDQPTDIRSIAMLPLRNNTGDATFGLLVLGSPDAERFTAEMATDFLSQLGETASAALSCLISSAD
ncbi:MAG: DUF484 family protein [Glaciimonas sp.]|nr:DUF484 family protein [Glaciimonas sp.]